MIYTGYFGKLKEYEKRGLTPVCIAGYAPKDYTGARYRALAPHRVWWQEWHDKGLSEKWYQDKYDETVLTQLNPHKVAADLQAFGKDVVLLCYEKPSEFCHRHLIANWLNKNGQNVMEYNLIRSAKPLSLDKQMTFDFIRES